MTDYMNALVEENLDCVKEILHKRIRIPKMPLLEYDDLYQVGCMALCKAAMHYVPGRGEFAPFACTVIYNDILTYCKEMYVRCRGKVDIDLSCDNDSFALLGESESARHAFDEILDESVFEAFHACRKRYSGIAGRGIEALEMKLLGYSTKEIAKHFKTTPNNVNAWISRARSRLRNDPEFNAVFR